MESQRNLLLIGLLFVSFLLFQQWQMDNAPESAQPQQVESFDGPSASADVPAASEALPQAAVSGQSQRQLIQVRTDLLALSIDTLGGDVVASELLTYPSEQGANESFRLLEQANGYNYIAQSGLIGRDGPDGRREGRPQYSVSSNSFELADGQEQLEVVLSWENAQGVRFDKVFTIGRGKYDVNVSYRINNTTDQPLQVQLYGQLKQSISKPNEEDSMMMQLYRGGAYSTQEERYEKFDFDEMADKALAKSTQGGWVAMIQHYFVSAWVPAADQQNALYSRILSNNQAAIGFKAEPMTIAANSQATLGADLYTGPKLQDMLKEVSETLYLTVDYGFLWWLAKPLHFAMTFFYGFVGNWGIAIILLTFAVRGLMYPLTKAQYTSMAKMRLLQPKMQALKERFGDDRQKMGQATMELYKKEQVNPLGGCLPLLLQMPIFLGLFWMLQESVELRHAPFMLWINDLSAMDPYYILPILMGITMFLMSKMQPSMSTDPMQQKMMQWMPVLFTVFFLWFPSGLVLYWVTSNFVTLLQQVVIFRGLEKQGLR